MSGLRKSVCVRNERSFCTSKEITNVYAEIETTLLTTAITKGATKLLGPTAI